ncbi:thioredoxin [Synechococcus sp. PCC 7502]|uniref:thioredoxin n=1 Tax=Synechococcus sp. PCC 7502 TaxID=1173263 RepID=UPI00210F4162|nr:thioredoxin [Synechococcus sp. PCC 7502]
MEQNKNCMTELIETANVVIEISDRTFEQEVIQSDLPVIVDFWASWCGPCKIIAPILTDIAQEYSGSVKVVKLNVDDNSETPSQYGIRSIPTLIIFKDGKKVESLVGALPKTSIIKAIQSVLDKI